MTVDEESLKLPDPIEAVDGSLVYQPLIMQRFVVEQEEANFIFQLHPTDTDACPQYLVVARCIPRIFLSLTFSLSLSLSLTPNDLFNMHTHMLSLHAQLTVRISGVSSMLLRLELLGLSSRRIYSHPMTMATVTGQCFLPSPPSVVSQALHFYLIP